MNVLLIATFLCSWPPLPEPTDWPQLPPIEQLAVAWPELPPLEKPEVKKPFETPDVELIYVGAEWCSTCPAAKKEAEKLEIDYAVRYFDVDRDADEKWVRYLVTNYGRAMPRFLVLVDDEPWYSFGARRDVAYLRGWLQRGGEEWRRRREPTPGPEPETVIETYRSFEIETPVSRAPPRTRVVYGCGNAGCRMCYGR